MRSKFDEQLDLLNKELIMMGSECELAIAQAVKAMLDGDVKLSKSVAPLESEIQDKERTIERMCLNLLLQQQPVAGDLRQISTALKMITDMGRVGSQAADVAEIVGFLNGRTGSQCDHIKDMARAIIRMLTDSINAYIKHDVVLASSVVEYDDVVDELFLRVKTTLIAYISEHPDDGEYSLDILMIAKYLERIGDHAVNIAEWVVFSVTGVHRGEEEL